MNYRPTISIVHSNNTDALSHSIQNEILIHWTDNPPLFIDEVYKKADIVLFFTDNYTELLSHLPSLIELHSHKVPTVIVCNELGDLQQLINQLNIPILESDIEPSMLVGILFGMLERSEEVSELRAKMGLMKALHNSTEDELQRFEDELNAAATVQREFMSDAVHSVHGTSFTTLWEPLSVVSGDMYDITQLDDDHVAFFIADAIGHGISAAMLAMMLTRTLASNRFDPFSGSYTEPKDMLMKLNHAMLQRSGDQARFATAAYGILNCKTKLLTYAGAGHPPALLNKANSSHQLLESEGPLLGVFDQDNDFKQNKIQLDSGDTLLIYSDGAEGVFGSISNSHDASLNHIETLREICNTANGDHVLTKIKTCLQNTNATISKDDLTMICLETDAHHLRSNMAA